MTKRRTPCKLVARVGARIRSLRLELGWSLKTLGKLAGTSIAGLQAIETGQSMTRVDTLCNIAQALRVEAFELLNDASAIDDVSYIVEKMRQDPEVARVVMGYLRRTTNR